MFENTLFSQYIYKSKYSRYLDKEGRRENWNETVGRYLQFICQYLVENHNYTIPSELMGELNDAILNHEVMPSMRALMTAGKAAERNHIAMYNCAYLPIDDLHSFDEMIAISMSGTGVGYSVESKNVKQIKELPDEFFDSETTIIFNDSRTGWAKGYREFLSLLTIGQVPKYDVSKLRGAGSRLKTMGGRSSGPEPLVDLLEFTKHLFKSAAGRRLTTLEVHDLSCKIGDIVVVGGVRRSAFISLSDLLDQLMRGAKSGNWYDTHPYRRLANNSAVYEEKPPIGVFMTEWLSLYNSHSGERGIISRPALKRVIQNANDFRTLHGTAWRLRDLDHDFGCNPCSEIILRPYEFCNLTEVVVYADDTPETLKRKVRLATILGTFQSCFTKFKYINKKWQKNCEEERLLGVSLTGIMDNEYTNGRFMEQGLEYPLQTLLESLKITAIETNVQFAELIGIEQSVAITCVKPSGTSSSLNGTRPGIHPANSPYYIRYVRQDLKDPLTDCMIDGGFPFEKDAYDPANVTCFKFPIKVPEGAVLKSDLTAVEHLELWLAYQKYFCEHKPSITVSVREDEWLDVGAWVYRNFEWASGISFLPADEGTTIYKQAPYTTCTEQQYEALLAQMPKDFDWATLAQYENEDMTTGSQELACAAGGCEV
jgi:ribonucleoside-triphosphate reductase (thioredoxin)